MTEPGYRLERDADGLTGRQRMVVLLLAQGYGPKVIGQKLKLSKQRASQIVMTLEDKGAVEVRDGRRYVRALTIEDEEEVGPNS